jgi:GH18 family chitinase
MVVLGLVLWAAAVRADEGVPGKPDRPAPAKFRVVGYLPEYRVAALDPAVGKYLTDVVFFSAEPDPSGTLDRHRLKPEAVKVLQGMKDRHGVALLLCVGGWERSRGFAPIAASARARQRFIREVMDFCRANRFDGVDLDWEHPGNEAERRDYATLLAELKRAFEPHGLRLTVAVAGWQVGSAEPFRTVDALHLMAYDADGRHSTYEFAEAQVTRLTRIGIPPAKICLGIPFYGRSVKKPAASRTYAEIVERFRPAPDVDEVDGLYFNNVATVQRKARLARERKLGGVMIWELGQDTNDERSLLRAIQREAGEARKSR